MNFYHVRECVGFHIKLTVLPCVCGAVDYFSPIQATIKGSGISDLCITLGALSHSPPNLSNSNWNSFLYEDRNAVLRRRRGSSAGISFPRSLFSLPEAARIQQRHFHVQVSDCDSDSINRFSISISRFLFLNFVTDGLDWISEEIRRSVAKSAGKNRLRSTKRRRRAGESRLRRRRRRLRRIKPRRLVRRMCERIQLQWREIR